MGEDEQARAEFSIKNVVAMVTILGSLVGIPLAIVKIDADARADSFTGTEGRELARRIDRLESQVERCTEQAQQCELDIKLHERIMHQ